MPRVCGVFASNSPARTTRTPLFRHLEDELLTRYLELKANLAQLGTGRVPRPFVKQCRSVPIEAYHGGTPSAVLGSADERARQEAFPFEAHSRPGQLFVPSRCVIAQQRKHRSRVGHVAESRLQSSLHLEHSV